MQSPTSFDMIPFLLGMKGPAQCVEMTTGPLRINIVPRDGRPPMVRYCARQMKPGEQQKLWGPAQTHADVLAVQQSAPPARLHSTLATRGCCLLKPTTIKVAALPQLGLTSHARPAACSR